MRRKTAPFAIAMAGMLLFSGCAAVSTGGPGGPRSYRTFSVVTAREGDTLSSLARDHLGDPARDWVIAEYNGVDIVRPGQALVIPRGPYKRGGLGRGHYQTVPVLSYHKIAENGADPMTVTRAAFEAQMNLLEEKGYRVISLDELYDFLEFKSGVPEKAVVLTFDDGWRSLYDLAFPILKKHGYRATLFATTSMITGSSKTLSWDQVRELSSSGIVDIQSHTVDHSDLTKGLSGGDLESYYDDLERELRSSRQAIVQKTGREPRYLAYPYGATNNLVAAAAAAAGYRGALTVKRGPNPFFMNNFRVKRSMIFGDFDLVRFEKNLGTSRSRALR